MSPRQLLVYMLLPLIKLVDKNKGDLLNRGQAEMNFTNIEMAKYLADKFKWGRGAPKVGDEAPDFEVERLTPQGERTGQTFRLSSARGKPIALVMGSYT